MNLADQITERRPLESGGASGNTLDRVILRDGRELILKRVSPQWDWISRATGDRGRAYSMWTHGLFDRFPGLIDHAIVGVEMHDDEWSIYMKDVSGVMVPDGGRLDRTKVDRLLDALCLLHETFWEESLPEDLCTLEDRYMLLSPETAAREKQLGNNKVGNLITDSWNLFSENVPKDIVDQITLMVDKPTLLADQLKKCSQTLIHGDVRLSNLGFTDEQVVLVDWGERTGPAPPPVELASFLIFDGLQLDVPREYVVEGYRQRATERFDETALQLALIGGFVQLGSNFGLRILLAKDDKDRALAIDDLSWWIPVVDKALETWAPG